MEYNPQFWQALDQLLARSALVIDRPKGSSHPRFPEMVYPLDYGYLENTASMDGEGVDVWVGTAQPPALDGLLWVVDLPKGDVEVKLLYGCTPQERELAFQFQTGRPICWPSWPCVLWRLWKNHSTENVFLHCARAGKFPPAARLFFLPKKFHHCSKLE